MAISGQPTISTFVRSITTSGEDRREATRKTESYLKGTSLRHGFVPMAP